MKSFSHFLGKVYKIDKSKKKKKLLFWLYHLLDSPSWCLASFTSDILHFFFSILMSLNLKKIVVILIPEKQILWSFHHSILYVFSQCTFLEASGDGPNSSIIANILKHAGWIHITFFILAYVQPIAKYCKYLTSLSLIFPFKQIKHIFCNPVAMS